MISKELLSEVINIKIEDIIDLKMFGKDLKYYEKYLFKSCCDGRLSDNKDSIRKSINIYELAHKCKEWVGSYGKYHCIYSGLYESTDQGTLYICLLDSNDFWADTEPEAIFKACQWILDNKKEGN